MEKPLNRSKSVYLKEERRFELFLNIVEFSNKWKLFSIITSFKAEGVWL